MTEREKYLKYHASESAIKARAKRTMARRAAVEKHGAAALQGKDVHHIRTPENGGTNDPSNLRIVSTHANRGVMKHRGK